MMVGQHGCMESRIGKGRALIVLTYLDDEGLVIPDAQFRLNGKLLSAELPTQKFDSPAVGFYKVLVGLDEQAA
jgi:hypothetical protein